MLYKKNSTSYKKNMADIDYNKFIELLLKGANTTDAEFIALTGELKARLEHAASRNMPQLFLNTAVRIFKQYRNDYEELERRGYRAFKKMKLDARGLKWPGKLRLMECKLCNEPATGKCGQSCDDTFYCSQECANTDWTSHKKTCKKK